MRTALTIAVSWILGAATVFAVQSGSDQPSFSLQLAPFGGAGGGGGELELTGQFQVAEGSRDGRLSITAKILPNWHVYSVTQLPGGPMKSELKVADSSQYELVGPFQADVPPAVKRYEFFDVPVEEHSDTVTWTAPIRLAEGVDPQSLRPVVTYQGQVCQDEGACIPIPPRKVPAKFAGYFQASQATGEHRAERSHVTILGQIKPRVAVPGSTVTLSLTAQPDPDWHVYSYAEQDAQEFSKSTLIVLSPDSWSAEGVQASAPPTQKVIEDIPMEYHNGPVTWTVQIKIPEDAAPGRHQLSGLIGYQTCSDSQCDPPLAARFSAEISIADTTLVEAQLVAFEAAKYTDAASMAETQAAIAKTPSTPVAAARLDLSQLEVEDEAKSLSIWLAIMIAFAGGFILNFMPCVLPVIGLKIMAFVEQAGQSRSAAFALNVWYALGMLAVFMVLATLAVVFNLGWGQQNQSVVFNVTMAAVVFTMGLSFLGVWEIPIPGFVGSGKTAELAEVEGVTGAFAKGIVTTVLAVPCSGPLVAPALAWSAGQAPPLIYLTFAVMGLGMAFPYLMIGAFPNLVQFLPRPGVWMETFKQVMGFVLLGTVIWIFSYLDWPYMLPTLMFLFGLWAACWWIGRISVTAEAGVKLRGWAMASGFATVIGMLAFMWFGGVMQQRYAASVAREIARLVDTVGSPQTTAGSAGHADELPWKPFSLRNLEDLTSQGKTVMVDFTADWCPNCKVLEKAVLNTQPVKSVVQQNGVVPLVADWTGPDREISEMLELLGSKQIPVLAIFPASRPNQPIVLRGSYSRQTLINKLQDAGPSRNVADLSSPQDANVLAERR